MKRVSRRRTLGAVGAAAVVAVAGCLGDDDAEPSTDAAEPGDEPEGTDELESTDDADQPEALGSAGLLYAFAPDRIVVADPHDGEAVTDIGDDVSNRDWADVRLTHDHSTLFAVDSSIGQVAAIDTETREIAEWVDVGGGPVHAYLPVEDELWVHSDDEGAFYVVDVDSLDVVEIVDSALENEGHGKLVYHDNLLPKAYATNTNDPAALVIDLEARERVDAIEIGGAGGTHYAAYAPGANRLIYEWYGGEMPVIDPETDEVVDSFDFIGGLALSPDERLVGVWSDESLRFIDATDEELEVLGTVELEGRGPDGIQFVETDDGLYAFVANTTAADVSVVDLDEMAVVEHAQAGAIETDGDHVHRADDSGDGHYFTTTDADGTIAVIDVNSRELRHEIEVAADVDTVRYIPENG